MAARSAAIPAALMLALSGCGEPAEVPLEALLDYAVRIEREGGFGSGVVVGRHLVLTNGHVVEGHNTAKVYLRDGSEATGTVVWRADPSVADAAVLYTDRPLGHSGGPPLRCSVGPKPGEGVVAVGNHAVAASVGSYWVPTWGRVLVQHGKDRSLWFTDAILNRGSSGGPVFDSKGRLIGLGTAITLDISDPFGVNFRTGLNLFTEVASVCGSLKEIGVLHEAHYVSR